MKTFVSKCNRITAYDGFMANLIGSFDLGNDYAISFAGYGDKTLAGTVGGKILLVDSGLEEVANLGNAVTCLESKGSTTYAIAGTKEFAVFENLKMRSVENVVAPGLSCIDVGEQILVGGYNGNIYRHDGKLETLIERPAEGNSIRCLKQYQDFIYVGLVKNRLRVLNGTKEVVNLNSRGTISGFTTAGDNLYFSADNELWKVVGHVLEERELLKKYRETNKIRNLQSVRVDGDDYLVFLYEDDIHFVDKDMKTKVVHPKFGKDEETIWGVYCHD